MRENQDMSRPAKMTYFIYTNIYLYLLIVFFLPLMAVCANMQYDMQYDIRYCVRYSRQVFGQLKGNRAG